VCFGSLCVLFSATDNRNREFQSLRRSTPHLFNILADNPERAKYKASPHYVTNCKITTIFLIGKKNNHSDPADTVPHSVHVRPPSLLLRQRAKKLLSFREYVYLCASVLNTRGTTIRIQSAVSFFAAVRLGPRCRCCAESSRSATVFLKSINYRSADYTFPQTISITLQSQQ